jgi:hypothetical protein
MATNSSICYPLGLFFSLFSRWFMGIGGVTQVVEHLPSKHEALSSDSTTAKNHPQTLDDLWRDLDAGHFSYISVDWNFIERKHCPPKIWAWWCIRESKCGLPNMKKNQPQSTQCTLAFSVGFIFPKLLSDINSVDHCS